MAHPTLPAWATFKSDDKGAPVKRGDAWIIDVDAPAMYGAMLDDYRALYADGIPADFPTQDGPLGEKAAKKLKAELDGKKPTAYWLEVCYQSMKLALQAACRTMALNIHVHDPAKAFAQKKHNPGRGPAQAAGGMSGGKEAREHFRRLFGFIPTV